MTTETRRFGMHQNLLYEVILKQAGTLQKAVLEGVMNGIDAGATRCDVTIDSHHFSISDNGHGFQSRREIEDFFEMFGTPHQEGDAIYGRFRMGRGQMMAFGKNVWRSRTFEMHVDIKGSGLDYALTEHADDHPGTTVEVELYDPVVASELERIKSELRSFVAWAQIPVFLNGEQISKKPETGKWTFEDENAYYALSHERQQLAVYNLGVLVTSMGSGRLGMGGTIVSKKQLDVNFARNDVQSSCPVFRKISAHVHKEAGKNVEKKVKLTDGERQMLVRDFQAGEIKISALSKLRILTDVNGRSWPIDKLSQIPHKFGSKLIVADRGDLMVETAQKRGIAFSIDQATLERFGTADATAFLDRVKQNIKASLNADRHGGAFTSRWRLEELVRMIPNDIQVISREELSSFVSSTHIALKDSEMTADFKVILAAIESGYTQMIFALNRSGYEDRTFAARKIRLGKSDTALAWTDGKKMIWIDTEHARLLRRGFPGAFQVATTLLHEMLHDGPDTGTHQHDFDFYQTFHDMTALPQDPLGAAANRMVSIFLSKLRQNKRKISQKLLARDDADIALEALREEIGVEDYA